MPILKIKIQELIIFISVESLNIYICIYTHTHTHTHICAYIYMLYRLPLRNWKESNPIKIGQNYNQGI